MSATFSFVTCTFQCARFVPRCHWSLTEQTCTDWEWIVVDDASTDDTAEAVAKLGDDRIRYLRLETNRGRGFARDYALRQANGDWTAIVDMDDFCFPDRLEMAAAARSQGSDFFCSALVAVDDGYAVRGVRRPAGGDYPRSFPHATLCGRSKLLRDIGYPGYRWGEDQSMVLTLANTANGSWSDEPVYGYHETARGGARGAFLGHYHALRQIRALRRRGVLRSGNGVRRLQWSGALRLLALPPFFLLPGLYRKTLNRRRADPGGDLRPERREFIARCAQRFPMRSAFNDEIRP
jgi:glycosyltransferase involved in cell wall biosynthesis